MEIGAIIDEELFIKLVECRGTDYVKDHENKERKETSRQCEPKWQFQVTNEIGTTPDFPCENENSSISGREALSNSIVTSELVATSISQSQTYNPAQDMLDMFLGPLLRKTIEKEETSKSIMENIKITHELTRKSQDEPTGGEIVPLMKTRNTLKDKVVLGSGISSGILACPSSIFTISNIVGRSDGEEFVHRRAT
ncbi:hypothetical protein RJT34_13911 [Clitoria ternatea]|uniref:Uncharacterized protein n=1 Tax=Clitoria ternatea TaxID=43366 RepID=A0AAN9JPS3_CLITE